MRDAKYPNIVYKYRNWLNPLHQDILYKNELYLSSPQDFNDPFDCRIPTNLFLLDDEEKKKKYITRIVSKNRNRFPQDKTLDELVTEFIKPFNEDLKSKQAQNESLHFDEQNKKYGIISFGTNWSNNLMWAHYANCHTGFCVGFKEPYLRNEKFGGWGGNVDYSNSFPHIDPNEDLSTAELEMKRMIRETHTKEKRWKYEKEYRVVKLFEKEVSVKERVVTIDNSAFESISLGLWFPETEIENILKVANEKQIPVYKMQKRQLSFKLYRTKISPEH